MTIFTPQFPLYIPSKGRSEYLITSKALARMNVAHSIIVEPQECDAYREQIRKHNLPATVIELDMGFKSTYEVCDEHGLTKSTGGGPARNFAWEHSKRAGYAWHWIMDDNIEDFYRIVQTKRVRCTAPAFWRAMEDYALQFRNVGMVGPAYDFFAPCGHQKLRPIILNTRIFSCNFIRNDVPYRWRGRYNEDIILSIDMLKAGWCTIQFQAFLQGKMRTQSVPGGNTSELYKGDGKREGQSYAVNGTFDKSLMLKRVHPDVVTLKWRFGRHHHHFSNKHFAHLKLMRDPNAPPLHGNYGMHLRCKV